MSVRVGVNGFGRIGRLVLRAALARPNVEVVAVNHRSRRLPANDEFTRKLALSLKYDSVHGKLDNHIVGDNDCISIDGKEIKVFSKADPKSIPWGDLGVDVVVESTGIFNVPEKAQWHITAGAKKVVISAPARGDCLTVVLGVNEELYDPSVHHVVSNASCTTNCLAPVAKVLLQKFGFVKGIMTTVHALTNSQQILDMPSRDVRRGRAANVSIIPTTTGAAAVVGLVLPELKGKLSGMAMRVPTQNVSIVDLVAQVEKKVTRDEINSAFQDASQGELKGILAYSDLPLVSADYNGDPHSATVDGLSTMVLEDDLVKVLAWYDNEWGYSNRVIDLVEYITEKGL